MHVAVHVQHLNDSFECLLTKIIRSMMAGNRKGEAHVEVHMGVAHMGMVGRMGAVAVSMFVVSMWGLAQIQTIGDGQTKKVVAHNTLDCNMAVPLGAWGAHWDLEPLPHPSFVLRVLCQPWNQFC